MKKILLFICLGLSITSYGKGHKHGGISNSPETEMASDCVATLDANGCAPGNGSSPILECYFVTVPGINHRIVMYVCSIPYGTTTGYAINYTLDGGNLTIVNGGFETKSEAISNFVHTVIGKKCSYTYK